MQNEVQYDLEWKAAKISALPSNNLEKYEYLTSKDLGYKPRVIEQAKFEYSPLGKIFNKILDKDDNKKEGCLKILKNIQKSKSSSNDNLSSFRSKSSEKTLVNEDEDEDEKEKTARDLYQGSIEGTKGLKLPGEIESKDEKSQMYLESNIGKIKNNSSDIYDKYRRFLKYNANGEKNHVNYEILSSKVDDINFYDRYGTLYKYLNYLLEFDVEIISKRDKSFLKDLLKGFKIKKTYDILKRNIDDEKKAYDNLVLKNKTIDDVV